MSDALRRQLEGAIQVVTAGLVIWIGLAAGNVYPWNLPVGRIVRWAVLAELCALALAYALLRRRMPRPDRLAILAAALPALALLSTLWSPDPWLTLGRAVTLAVLFVTGGALAFGGAGRAGVTGTVLLGLLAGATLLALGGLVNLAVDSGRALVPATVGQGARYNGLGENPNTMAMLLALSLPLALWALLEARSRLGKRAAALTIVLFAGSISASGSRGALAAGLVAVLAATLALPPSGRLRPALAAAAVAAFAVSLAVTQIPPKAERNPVLNQRFGARAPLAPNDADFILPLQAEIGFPAPGTAPPPRGLLDSSGRIQAWVGALEQMAERPILGYGFGTEEVVFVDRYFRLLSTRVENGYIGMSLQLGAAGLVLVCALLALVVVRAGQCLPDLAEPERRRAAACLGVVAGGLVLAVTQSFWTSVGSPATAPFWLCALLLAQQAGGARAPQAPGRAHARA